MSTHPGSPRPDEDLAALLLECHGRIRTFVALAGTLARAASPEPRDVAETAERLGRSFGEALALHAEDEELSILPRLAGRDRDVDAALVAMHRDHQRHALAAGRLLAMCDELVRDPARLGALGPTLDAAARALADHFAGHLANEEEIIVPALRRLLPEAVQREVVLELRARRAAPAAPAGGSPQSSR